MLNNYFTLLAVCSEVQEKLAGGIATESYSFVADTLLIEFYLNPKEYLLEISLAPQKQYITLREFSSKPKRNFASFFGDSLPLRFQGVYISQSDRIIAIEFDGYTLYCSLRGAKSNVYLYFGDELVQPFKKIKEPNFQEDFLESVYGLPNEIPPLPDFETIPELREKYPIIGKEIVNYLISQNIDNKAEIEKLLNRIHKGEFSLVFNEKNQLEFISSELSLIENEHFRGDVLSSISKYIIDVDRVKTLVQTNEQQLKKVQKEINSLSHKIDGYKKRKEIGNRSILFTLYGNLLLTYPHLVKRGMKDVLLTSFDETGKEITVNVPIKEKLNAFENADYYFERSRAETIELNKIDEILAKAEQKLQDLLFLNNEIKSKLESTAVSPIEKVRAQKKQMDSEKTFPFKTYRIDGQFMFYVGRDSKNNDELTMRFAKQNDLWFHARAVPGSHCVLRVESGVDVPTTVIKKACSIAAYHSKAKTAGTVPVSCIEKKYVIKKKGMEPGKVALLKENVILVQPEIPQGCEYLSTDNNK